MIDLNSLLNDVINDAINIGFPVQNNLQRHVYVDKRQYDRVGACYRYKFPEKYEIHLSENTTKAKTHEIKNIIAHEVLHANFLTMEHNNFWHLYCNRMNEKLGYKIKVKYSWDELLSK